MAIERTLSIVKPNAVKKNIIGEVYRRIELAGLKIVAARMLHMDAEKAAGFYVEHKEKPFFGELVEFMTSGPCLVQVLEGENAIGHYRDLMGATDPKNAPVGTIRRDLGDSRDENTVHGSDSSVSAKREINYFFNENEICPH